MSFSASRHFRLIGFGLLLKLIKMIQIFQSSLKIVHYIVMFVKQANWLSYVNYLA